MSTFTGNCPCDEPVDPAVEIARALNAIAAGQRALPRQVRSFPGVREALLAGIRAPGRDALREWRARNSRDLGLMLLEMWAYVSDVLSFYDERIANETYIRTAQRSISLRRLVDLLGYIPAPGLAGSVTLAALAEGRKSVTLPVGTAFRSDAFENEPPQVFELGAETAIHPFKNEWTIGPVKPADFPQATPTQIEIAQATGTLPAGQFLVFEPLGFGLAVDRLALITVAGGLVQARRVVSICSFAGKDGRTYAEVEFKPSIQFLGLSSTAPVVQVPTVTAAVTRNKPANGEQALFPFPVPDEQGDHVFHADTSVYLDSIYRQIRKGDHIIITVGNDDPLVAPVESTEELEVVVQEAVPGDNEGDPPKVPAVKTRVTRLVLFDIALSLGRDNETTFHFAFVDGGRVANVGETELGRGVLTQGPLSVDGIVERPPEVEPGGPLDQPFLLTDPDGTGAKVDEGTMRFLSSGRAQFTINTNPADLPEMLKTPLTVFGNLLTATRGETVFNEVLGSGDPRVASQEFRLKKSPLTYLPATNELGRESTLRLFVDGVRWKEVRTFFSCGPQDRVYIVRHDEEQNTRIIFGDGVRGSRLPAGVSNVVATYRFGAGAKAPPAGAIQQIARQVLGLRSVRSPVAAMPGKDPDPPEHLRTLAPVSARLMGRAVSPQDFEALASLEAGVVRARAEFSWHPAEQQAGVTVTYIGEPDEESLRKKLLQFGEVGMPIDVVKAISDPPNVLLTIAADPDFEREGLERAVKEALFDPETGPFAVSNVPIDAPLLISPIYEALHSVPGVVAVAGLWIFAVQYQGGLFAPDHDMLCPVIPGYFLDFESPNATITIIFTDPVGPVTATRAGGC